MLTADRLSWPGVDQERARSAADFLLIAVWRQRNAVTALREGRRVHARGWIRSGLECCRIARGALGAVGFEKGGWL